VGALPGRIVVALGLPGQPPPPAPANVELHAYLDREKQQLMMNRAKLVVCRSGYTTLMELAQLGKPALLIPTPGQTEQIYLGQTLMKRAMFHCVEQQKLDLVRDVELAKQCPGCIATVTPEQAAQRFVQTVLGS
jgi:UDP-N-acetylglucosamine:LPS N-acetylglucosamine transferase